MRSRTKRVKVRRTRSLINAKEPHKRTAKALGLTKIGREKVFKLTPQIEGMIKQIHHLIKVEEA